MTSPSAESGEAFPAGGPILPSSLAEQAARHGTARHAQDGGYATIARPVIWKGKLAKVVVVAVPECDASVLGPQMVASDMPGRRRKPVAAVGPWYGLKAGAVAVHRKTMHYNRRQKESDHPQAIQDSHLLPAPGDGGAGAARDEGGRPVRERAAQTGHPPVHGGAGVAQAGTAALRPDYIAGTSQQGHRRLRRHIDRLKPLVLSFVSSFLARELKDARARWRRGLKGE